MSCVKHFLGFKWERHSWHRRVTATEREAFPDTSMWGRPITNEHVICHAEYVCEHCGAVRDDGDCGCDAERGAQCPVRLAYLERHAEGADARA